MNIEIYRNEELQKEVVSSRVIANQLDRRHSDVMTAIRGIRNDPHTPHGMIYGNNYTNEQNRENYPEYLLTKDGFILYMFNIQGHNKFKISYINCFNEMEKALKVKPLTGQILIATALIEANRIMENQEKEIEILKPKAELADAAIRDESKHYCITDAGKLLGINQTRIFRILRSNYLLTSKRLPTQKALNEEILDIRNNVRGGKNYPQAIMTMKNIDNFRKKYLSQEKIK